ncbi:hypothetical protein [Nonomuraea ferruginea]|uniref:RanBP2-type domain-containing protein n=1 Tax=Nonomuraea ferruginea TaxID=46174 RepID=A0ABT4T752_9ACTN|nr:hypothetical protein [Nonomuraea ferruginea]MDA0645332.1 hypothetical protein [Nonomuraea ferruginea]
MATVIALLAACLPFITLSYIIICLAWPWSRCTRCRPGGKNRTCRACNGTGKRPRLGWQIYVYARRLHRDGNH